MSFNVAARVFAIGFCAFLAFVLLSLLIRNQRRVPQYTLAEAHQVAGSSRTNALIMLAVIPVGDVIAWLFSEHSGPLSTFVIILCIGDGLCFLNVLYELQKMHLAKKRIREIELHPQGPSGHQEKHDQYNDSRASRNKVK